VCVLPARVRSPTSTPVSHPGIVGSFQMNLSMRGATKGLQRTRYRSDLSKGVSSFLYIVVGLVVYRWCVCEVCVCVV
jgi:hypothetical protein